MARRLIFNAGTYPVIHCALCQAGRGLITALNFQSQEAHRTGMFISGAPLYPALIITLNTLPKAVTGLPLDKGRFCETCSKFSLTDTLCFHAVYLVLVKHIARFILVSRAFSIWIFWNIKWFQMVTDFLGWITRNGEGDNAHAHFAQKGFWDHLWKSFQIKKL